MKNLNYTDLFRQIATRHVLLAHNEVSKPAFVRVVNSASPVPYLFSQEFTAQCSVLQPPFMVLETYDNSYQQNQADGKYKLYSGAFLILDKPDIGDNNDIDAKLDVCEGIAEDVLALLRQLFKTYTPFKGYSIDLNNQNMEKIGPVADGFFGVRFNLFFTREHNGALTYSGVKWLASGTSGTANDIITLFAN